MCHFYDVTQHGSCHDISWRMQGFLCDEVVMLGETIKGTFCRINSIHRHSIGVRAELTL